MIALILIEVLEYSVELVAVVVKALDSGDI